jgi:hypothetical protein
MNVPSHEICQRLIKLHCDLGQSNGADCLDPLLNVLAQSGLSWSDLPELFFVCGMTSSQPKRLRRSVNGMHELVGRASTLGERRRARDKLIKRLADEGLNWTDDLPGLLAAEWRERNPTNPGPSPASAANDDINPFDLMATVVEDRVVLSKAQCTVVALWILNSFVYERFSHVPQLGIVAPASGCGKSTLRKTLGATARSAWHTHNATPAVIYRALVRNPRMAVLLDEAENFDWSTNSKMRAIMDAACESDGAIDLVDRDGDPRKFQILPRWPGPCAARPATCQLRCFRARLSFE